VSAWFWTLCGIFAGLAALSAIAIYLFRRVWRSQGALRAAAINGVLLLIATGYTLLALEVLAYHFIVFPDGFNITLASHRWFERYWKPVNSWGQRGPEPDLEAFAKGPSLLFVGDSFTAGSGLEDWRDQFSVQAKEKLAGQWQVETLAGRGWDTDKEYQRLTEWPVKPDRIVWQYYLNDIGHAAIEAGRRHTVAPSPLPAPAQWVVDRSYFINFVYFQVFRAGQLFRNENFWQQLKGHYADEELWRIHTTWLDKVVAYCREHDIALSVLIFPNLFDIADSREITGKVRGFFESKGIRVVDLSDHFADRDPGSLVINVTNGHPNAATHHEVADIVIKELGLQHGG
jgi:hypothetical protein